MRFHCTNLTPPPLISPPPHVMTVPIGGGMVYCWDRAHLLEKLPLTQRSVIGVKLKRSGHALGVFLGPFPTHAHFPLPPCFASSRYHPVSTPNNPQIEWPLELGIWTHNPQICLAP